MATKNDTQRSITAICIQCTCQMLGVIAAVAALFKLSLFSYTHRAQLKELLVNLAEFCNTFGHTLSYGWAFWAWLGLMGYGACISYKTNRAKHSKTSLVAGLLSFASLFWALNAAAAWDDYWTGELVKLTVGLIFLIGIMFGPPSSHSKRT